MEQMSLGQYFLFCWPFYFETPNLEAQPVCPALSVEPGLRFTLTLWLPLFQFPFSPSRPDHGGRHSAPAQPPSTQTIVLIVSPLSVPYAFPLFLTLTNDKCQQLTCLFFFGGGGMCVLHLHSTVMVLYT